MAIPTLQLSTTPNFSLATPGSMPTGRVTQFMNLIQSFMDLIPDPTTGIAVTYRTDYDQIPPSTAKKIRDQLTYIKTMISSLPTMGAL